MNVLRIIAAALIAGPTLFALIAILLTANKPPGNPTIGYLAAAFAAGSVIASSIVPELMAKQIVQQGGSTIEAILNAFQTRLLVRSALLEGAAFFAIIAYLVTAQWWTLAIAGGLLGIMILRFPTEGQLESFIRNFRDSASFKE